MNQSLPLIQNHSILLCLQHANHSMWVFLPHVFINRQTPGMYLAVKKDRGQAADGAINICVEGVRARAANNPLTSCVGQRERQIWDAWPVLFVEARVVEN